MRQLDDTRDFEVRKAAMPKGDANPNAQDAGKLTKGSVRLVAMRRPTN